MQGCIEGYALSECTLKDYVNVVNMHACVGAHVEMHCVNAWM